MRHYPVGRLPPRTIDHGRGSQGECAVGAAEHERTGIVSPLGLPDEVCKIAVLRANGLGDLVFALPSLVALRARYPGAEIVLLGREWMRDFLAGRPGPIDRVEPVPAVPGLGLLDSDSYSIDETARLEHFFAAMRREQYDVAVQIHGGGSHSNPFLQRLGARYTVGLKAADAPPLDRWVPHTYFQHEVMRYLEVVALLGATTSEIEPRIDVVPSDVDESLRVVPHDVKAMAVLHPGATDPRRRWPVERFAAVGDALARAGARVGVSGIRTEWQLVQGGVEAMEEPAVDLSGRLSVNGLCGLLSRSSVVVSNDSGPLHLAAAVGARTTGIYWCGNFINGGPLTRTRHRTAISWCLECPACGANNLSVRCAHASSFVADVSIDEVQTAALELIAVSCQHGVQRSRQGRR
ncbi:MAG: glycosyltransferase family 9 protein [Chloroflexi bacterium]|nr:glycosyltransferase family 9 protein [Chloroflexota bacterium]